MLKMDDQLAFFSKFNNLLFEQREVVGRSLKWGMKEGSKTRG